MEVKHASLVQVRRGRDGRRTLIEEDVLDTVRQLKEVSDRLSVNWNEYGEYFAVVETCDDGVERLVTTATELTPQLVEHVRRLGTADYDYAKELERMDDEAEAAKVKQFQDDMGLVGERMFHAMRKDVEVRDTIYVPDVRHLRG